MQQRARVKSHPPKVSKYQPIWDTLKAKKICRITADPVHHRTIIKMLKNKRDDDKGYQFELAEANRTHTIKIHIAGTVIEFRLLERITVYGL